MPRKSETTDVKAGIGKGVNGPALFLPFFACRRVSHSGFRSSFVPPAQSGRGPEAQAAKPGKEKSPNANRIQAQSRGAAGRTRTGTALLPRDFKSLVSANFTTAADRIIFNFPLPVTAESRSGGAPEKTGRHGPNTVRRIYRSGKRTFGL